MPTSAEIIAELKSYADPKNVEGMTRFGISSKNTLGVSVVTLRKIAKEVGRSHGLALDLWKSGIHEARMLAALVDEVDKTTPKQMDAWVRDFDSWDICDSACLHLFRKTEFARDKALEWSKKDSEFVRRAGFALMATLAVHEAKMQDSDFEEFFKRIAAEATDERNFVKKAVNWALRQIGKRNENLKKRALEVAEEILKLDSKSAKWVARDAMRELKILKV